MPELFMGWVNPRVWLGWVDLGRRNWTHNHGQLWPVPVLILSRTEQWVKQPKNKKKHIFDANNVTWTQNNPSN